MGVKISKEDFATLLKERAITCDPEYQYRVGQCYFFADNVEKDYSEAMKWYRVAAEQRHPGAQNKLGNMFERGFGVEQDGREAVRWYKSAAEQGYALAQYNLALCYEDGMGVPEDHSEALRLYALSSKQGFWRASCVLGELYSDGTHIEQDLVKARRYYQKALNDASFPLAPAGESDRADIMAKIAEMNEMLTKIENKVEAARKAERTEVFISYAHKDDSYIEELRPFLKMLENTTNIIWWDDSKIKAGEAWDQKIQGALSKAKVAVLMASANFFASDYVWRKELPTILEAADQDGATILWLPVSACPYEETGITRFQAIITDLEKPLDKHAPAERNEVYTKLFRRISELFKMQKE